MSLEFMDQAACKDRPEVNFFPGQGETIRPAVDICVGECAVREQCLEYGTSQAHGIYGGVSERGRRIIRRERKLADIVEL